MPEPGDRYVIAEVCLLLLRMAAQAGLDRAGLLEQAGLTELDLAERDTRIPLALQVRLGQALLARLPSANLALRLGPAAVPGSLGVLGQVMASSANLGAAFDAFARFHCLVSNAIHLDLTRGAGTVRVVLRMAPELEALRHPVEAVFVLWVALGRQLTASDWKPLRVAFHHAPAGDAAEHERFYGAPVAFAQDESVLELHRSTLALPIASARPDRLALFTAHAEALLPELEREKTTTQSVSRHLVTALRDRPVQQGDVARALGLSLRTLSRRLHDEGTSFGELLDRVRRDLAVAYLRDESLAVYEVALLLGYSEPSTFHRSFRQWTGQTPLSYRRGSAGPGRAAWRDFP